MEKEVKHGISLLPDCRPDRRSAADYYDDVLALSRAADEYGLDYVKMTEHYLGDYGGYCPSPLTFLAAVAAQTRRIRLMTGCVLPAFHHPVQLAAHAAMVDVISHGRLDIGFARAWLPYEFEALGVPLDTSRARYEATIRAVLRLWSEERVSEHTPFFSFDDATSLPPVAQRPHPPVWGAATRSRQSFEWLARQGFGLLVSPSPLRRDLAYTADLVRTYRETFRAVHGGSGPQPQVAVSLPLYVAESDEAAYRSALPHLREYLDVTTRAARSWSRTQSTNYPGYEAMADAFGRIGDDELRYEGTAAIGGPDTVIEAVEALRRDLSADVCLWQIDFGGQDRESMERSLGLFAEKVLPSVR
jgi:alkanesulfonate monooxygenase SsuD/methylene tetrahydromethanopterin reductase-like flavin-dependent oxidoreductase (luciferase family)